MRKVRICTTLFFVFWIMAVGPIAHAATVGGLPARFLGHWCNGVGSNEYRRCPESKEGITLRTDGYEAPEMGCDVVKSATKKRGEYLVKFRCSSDEGGKHTIWIEKYAISLIEGTLFMRKTNREP